MKETSRKRAQFKIDRYYDGVGLRYLILFDFHLVGDLCPRLLSAVWNCETVAAILPFLCHSSHSFYVLPEGSSFWTLKLNNFDLKNQTFDQFQPWETKICTNLTLKPKFWQFFQSIYWKIWAEKPKNLNFDNFLP